METRIPQDFGEVICARSPGAASWVGAGVTAFISLAAATGGILIVKNGLGPPMDWNSALLALFPAAIAVTLALFCRKFLSDATTLMVYCEKGAARAVRGELLLIPYSDVAVLQYSVVEHRHNGVSLNMSVLIELRTHDGRLLRDRWPLKSARRGGSTVALERVRNLVSEHIQSSIASGLTAGQTYLWAEVIEITSDGLTLLHGTAKQHVPFVSIDGLAMDGLYVSFFLRGDGQPFARLPMDAANSWPYVRLVSQLCRHEPGD